MPTHLIVSVSSEATMTLLGSHHCHLHTLQTGFKTINQQLCCESGQVKHFCPQTYVSFWFLSFLRCSKIYQI